ncbi:hypothetical protein GGF31_007339 [Allomyces arbusculus]|nr:hypothetical protein GGF31_007339 [Allomyces arbusculus]
MMATDLIKEELIRSINHGASSAPPSYAKVSSTRSSSASDLLKEQVLQSASSSASDGLLTSTNFLAALRFLIYSESPANYAAVENLLSEDASSSVVERTRVPLPFAPALNLIVTTFSVALPQLKLRWLGTDTAPAPLSSLVEAASSPTELSELFAATSDNLELIKTASRDDKDGKVLVELVQLPTPADMQYLRDTDRQSYFDTLVRIINVLFRSDIVPQGLIFASGFPEGLSSSTVESYSHYLTQYGTFCPNVTLLFTDYNPHVVFMSGDKYLDVSKRLNKIKADLNRPDLPTVALPVATTLPPAGRAARVAFYYQQRAALIDLLSKCARDSKLTAESVRVEMQEFIKVWLSSVLVGVETIRKGLVATKTLLASDLVEMTKEANVCANILSDNTHEIATRDAQITRQQQIKPYQDTGLVLTSVLAAVLVERLGVAVAATVAAALAALVLMLVHDRHDKVQRFKDARREATARETKLKRGKAIVDAKVRLVETRLAAIDKWSAELDALQAAISADDMSVVTLLAMSKPLLRLAAQLTSDYPKPEAADVVGLAVAFVADKKVARELGAMLLVLTPKLELQPNNKDLIKLYAKAGIPSGASRMPAFVFPAKVPEVTEQAIVPVQQGPSLPAGQRFAQQQIAMPANIYLKDGLTLSNLVFAATAHGALPELPNDLNELDLPEFEAGE